MKFILSGAIDADGLIGSLPIFPAEFPAEANLNGKLGSGYRGFFDNHLATSLRFRTEADFNAIPPST